LGSDVAGTLSLANGGTGASTPAAARAALGSAASGINSDIVSLTALNSVAVSNSFTANGSGMMVSVPLTVTSGVITGNGAGLTNVSSTPTNFSGSLAGDVTGTQSATVVGRIQGVSVSASAPTANQLLRYNGANWTPGAVALGSDVAGTLSLANGGTGASTPAAARANLGTAASGTNSDIASLTGLNSLAVSSSFTANGSGMIVSVPLTVTTGVITGNGAGLTNVSSTPTNFSGSLAGDVAGTQSATVVGRIQGVSVSPSAPTANQHLRYNGANWVPGAVALGTDVAGTLPVANGGTGASTPAAARAALGTAASGTNSDIASLTGLNSLAVSNSFTANGSGMIVSVPLTVTTGVITGNGGGLTNITSTPTNFSGSLAGDVTGPQNATVVGRLQGVSVSASAPLAGQHLRYNGISWAPGPVALGSDVTGTLPVASGGTAASTPAAARTALGSAASGTNSDIVSLTALSSLAVANSFTANGSAMVVSVPLTVTTGVISGNGAGLTNLTAPAATNFSGSLAGDVTGTQTTTLVGRIRGVNVSATAPAANQVLRYNGSNWAAGAVALGSDVAGTLPVANGGTGASTPAGARAALGSAAGGTNSDIVALTTLNSIAVSNSFSANGTAMLVNVPLTVTTGIITGNGAGLTNLTASTTNFSGSFSGDVTGTQNATVVGRIRGVSVSVAAPSANQFLRYNGTSWTSGGVALATDVSGTLAITNGGSGQSNYAPGDILYAPAANSLSRLAVGVTNQTLAVSNGLPAWSPANSHDHLGQFWTGAGSDGLFVENTSTADGVAGLTGSAAGANNLNYGVFGQSASTNGTGVQGFAFASSGFTAGVYGESTSTNGTGVWGVGSAVSGVPVGVYGESDSPTGTGVYGIGASTSGVPVGVYGQVSTSAGYGLYTPNRLYVGDAATILGTLNSGNISMAATGKLLADAGSSNAPAIAFNANSTTGFFTPATNTIGIATAGTNRVFIGPDGKVGLGRVPATNNLEVAGDASKATGGSWLVNSDARIKTEVRDLPDPLATIDRVHPVSFRYTEGYLQSHPAIQNKQYYNVIAQEYAEVFPDSVKQSGEVLDGKPILQVDIHPATIYSIAAIQELHGLVKARDAELEELKRQNAALERRLEALEEKATKP
jgi:hypothetical protein